MFSRASIVVLSALFAAPLATPAAAIDGEVLITHANALAGNVTPGDAAGYPVSLSLPGSYKFAGNLTVPAGKHGILVNNHDVTIDFAGFRLWSNSDAFIGIVGYFNSLTIKNGTIANFRGNAIYGTGHFWSIENMRIAVNGDDGIHVGGRSWTIANSQIVENGGRGIDGYGGDARNILIRNNVVNGNLDRGLSLISGHVEGNIIAGNQDYGIAISAGTVLGNTIIDNASVGLIAGSIVGYGNNTFSGNNGTDPDVFDGFQLHPNTCNGAAC